MEVALLLGLAALGYALAPQIAAEQRKLRKEIEKKNPKETFLSPLPFNDTDKVTVIQASEGHNNMVPFFGSNVTQSTYNGATDGILDTYTGSGKNTFFHKEEAPSFFEPEAGTGLPWGKQVETDFCLHFVLSTLCFIYTLFYLHSVLSTLCVNKNLCLLK